MFFIIHAEIFHHLFKDAFFFATGDHPLDEFPGAASYKLANFIQGPFRHAVYPQGVIGSFLQVF